MKRPGVCAAILLGSLVACGGTTSSVIQGPHPASVRGISVPFPPPPAEIEVIPLQRRDVCAWRDGFWDFRSGGWEWQKGDWVVANLDCFYAVPETRFESTPAGVALVYRRGAWFEKKGERACPAPPSCTAASASP